MVFFTFNGGTATLVNFLNQFSPIAIQETFHDDDDRRAAKVNAFNYTSKLTKLPESLRISISQELELVRAPASCIADYYSLKWLKPKVIEKKISPEKQLRKSISGADATPRVANHRGDVPRTPIRKGPIIPEPAPVPQLEFIIQSMIIYRSHLIEPETASDLSQFLVLSA